MIFSLAIGRFEARALSVGGLRGWLAVVLATLVLAACGGGGGGSGGGDSVTQPSLAITQQPADQRVTSGSGATFRVAANGAASFQWQRLGADSQWADIAGATGADLVLTGLTEADNGRQYRAMVKAGTVVLTSSAATLSVTPPAPAGVAVQPSDVQARVGQAPSFSVTASGTNVAYQWQSSVDGIAWTDVAGAATETLTLPTATLADSGKLYRVVVRNNLASVTSRAVTLSVLPALAKPQFTAQPQDRSVNAGQSATFTATASGEPTPTLQWETSLDGQSWASVAGATTATLVVANVVKADDGRRYRAVATNTQGSETSAIARLTIAPAVLPTLVREPQPVEVLQSKSAAFEVQASGNPTPTYQWQVSLDDGKTFANINGATGMRLELQTTVDADDGKLFRVVASNLAGDLVSSAARLTLLRLPVVILQPKDVVSGVSRPAVTLTVAGTGKPAPTVQWQASKDDGASYQDIGGATAASYTWSPTNADDRQLLRAKLSNSVGVAYSSAARIKKARWTAVSPSFVNSAMKSIRWLDTRVAVAVGKRGIVIRTADAGTTWQFVQEPMPGQPEYSKLAVLDANTVLAAGDNGTLIRSEDAGLTWRSIPIPITKNLAALSFRNASIGVMVSPDDGAFRSVDGGLTWTRIPSSDPAKPFEKLRGVTLRGLVGLAAGESAWFRSADGGASWTALNAPVSFFPTLYATYFTFVDDQTVMASGGRFARSTDGGVTWNHWALPPAGTSTSELKFSADGQTGFSLSGDIRSTDRGQTWISQGYSYISSIDADLSSSGVFLGVGSGGQLRQSTDNGATWSTPYGSQGLDRVSIQALEFPGNDGHGIAFGSIAQTTVLFQTDDGGRNWRPLQQFAATGSDAETTATFLDSQVGMAARTNGPLLRTTDGGRSWTQMPTYPVTGNNGVALADSSTVLMSFPRGVIRSTDGGSHWAQTLAITPGPAELGMRTVSAHGNVVLAPDANGQMYRSIDGGAIWRVFTYPGGTPVSMTWVGNSTVFMLQNFGRLIRSDDAGITWRTVLSAPTPQEWFMTVRFSADGQLGIVTSILGIYRSSDGGQTWNRDLDFWDTYFWQTVGFAGSRQPVVAGESGMLLVGSGYQD